MTAPRMAYVGVEGCGCVTGVTVDDPRCRSDVACDVGNWVRRGRTVERTTVEDARQRLTFTCPHRGGQSWHEIACEEGAAAS